MPTGGEIPSTPWVPTVRWIEHVRSRSCEVCTGRDSIVLACRPAARGSLVAPHRRPDPDGAAAIAQPRWRASADRRRRRPRRFIVQDKLVRWALGKVFTGPGKETASRLASADRRCARSPANHVAAFAGTRLSPAPSLQRRVPVGDAGDASRT
jgi:hypothetical protein